jgi:hypothetical protein
LFSALNERLGLLSANESFCVREFNFGDLGRSTHNDALVLNRKAQECIGAFNIQFSADVRPVVLNGAIVN